MIRTRHILFPVILVALFLTAAYDSYGQSSPYKPNLFDRIGINVEHGLHGAVPEENVDLFTGNVTLRYLDIYLPGPNGLDVKVWRVYNSKLIRDRFSGGGPSIQQEPFSWVGLGWTMHMGRLHSPSSETPLLEYPDGRQETLFRNKYNSTYFVSKDFVKYDRNQQKLYFKDGVVWTLGAQRTIYYADHIENDVLLVTRIENSYGQHIDISYANNNAIMTEIADGFQRQITFSADYGQPSYPKLTQIGVKNATGSLVYYSYSIGTYPTGSYYKLNQFTAPGLPAATFLYKDGSSSQYELTKVTTPFGGYILYEYADKSFYYMNDSYILTRVMNQKRVKFTSTGVEKTWTYSYPDYHNVPTGTVSVVGPEITQNVTYYAYSPNYEWRIGLVSQKTFSDNSSSESYTWLPQQISDTHWLVLSTDMGPAIAPLVQTITRTTAGDASSKAEYQYSDTLIKYGLASRINYYGNDLNTLVGYKTLQYYFENHSAYYSDSPGRYLLDFISDETLKDSNNNPIKETKTQYYEYDNYWGAIDWVKRLTSSGTFLTWDYTYSYPSGTGHPELIQIKIDLPGAAGEEIYQYRYGVLSNIERPGFPAYIEVNRQVSQYNSSISSETNQHGGTVNFTYDSLGRITLIDLPSGFNDIAAQWSTNYVTITQGVSPNVNTIKKYWDGLGRDSGLEEIGDSTTLYSRKTLDSEGRVTEESQASTAITNTYKYLLNAAGNATKITDPKGKETTIAYSSNVKTVTDAESHIKRFEYAGLPGLVTKLTDAQSRDALYTYDGIGRLTQVVYGARTQSYSYDGLDNVITETHPETGLIGYTYTPENNLDQKTWGGVTLSHTYNAGNQLLALSSGNETITYAYDTNGRVKEISSNLGWNRTGITYNPFGSVLTETQGIPGLPSKALSYTYDGKNLLKETTYPDGIKLTVTNNGLNSPKSLVFGTKTIISAMSYGPNKRPTSMTIAGNGTAFTATYDASSFLSRATLKKSSTTIYDASYGYDGVGNILSITSPYPTPRMDANFAYDSLYRLTSVTYTQGVGRVNSISYGYDNYGNMLSVQENGVTIPGFPKTYLGSNQMHGYTYDSRGNLLSADGRSYYWDNQNRLRQLRDAAGQVLGDYLYNERGLRIFALPPAAEINIKEGSQNVPDGGSVSFVCPFGSYVDKTFTIDNALGSADLVLSGSPYVLLSGDDFSILQQPVSPIPPGGSSTFTVRFQPLSPGDKTGSISIPNNDLNEDPYNITLNGINPVPEINIKQGTNNIVDGGSVGFASNVGSYEDKTFSIENLGAADLILSGSPIVVITGPNADQFSVQQQPVSPVSPSGSTSFVIRFQPTSMGNKTAAISISNNDSNENPYDITLNGHTPQPEMEIDWSWDGGTYDFGTICIGEWWETAFTIYNYGDANLVLSGTPIVQIQGPDWDNFYVTQQPNSTVLPGQYTTFRIRFTPNRGGLLQASISIANNDANENPYDITLLGTGDMNCPNKIINNASFTIISPAEGEKIEADTSTDIRWKGAESSKYVKIEYSNDNGSTYKTVSGRTQNTGLYRWKVPQDISPSCLLRISDAEGLPVIPEQLTYEFMFKASRLQSTPEMGQFIIHAGVPDVAAQLYRFADISFIPDIDAGMTNIYINSALVESTELESFIDVWQQLRILFNLEAKTGSVWIDDWPIIEGFPLNAKILSDSSTASALSYTSSVPIRIWIEDLDVRLQDKNAEILAQEDTGVIIKPLIWEGFNKYQVGALPAGWVWEIGQKAIQEDSSRGLISYQVVSPKSADSGRSEAAENSERGFYIDGQEFISGPRSLKINSSVWPVHAEKRISLPDRAPFGISEGTFAIVAGTGDPEGKPDEEATQKSRKNQGRPAGEREYVIGNRQLLQESSQERMITRLKADDRAGDSSNSGGEDEVKMLSASPVGSFYIYSYDGKLMAEYNTYGQWVRDYIYVGNQLVAEYKGGTTYYYYATDQINSTRVVTDNSGSVIYSAAYDPYGGIQKTWVSTYAPTMKFSGKERDQESQLDYYGARYYFTAYYRWLSVDPVFSREEASGNPQLWNLYSFCRNSPVTYIDPLGLDNYIFYDPNSFAEQAKAEKSRLESKDKSEKTNAIEITTVDQFRKAWDSMEDPTDVTLIFHSGAGWEAGATTISIDAEMGQYVTSRPEGTTPSGHKALYIGDLAKKTFDTLNLYVCNAGSPFKINNTAFAFYNNHNISKVKASPFMVNFNPSNYRPAWYILWITYERR